MVAVTYFNGFRIIIPMNEMMINLQGDGRENADTLNRQVRIANNMLGCDIDFIIKDLDNKSRSVVASRKDAMLKKRQTFYLGEDTEKPMLYEGRIVEARVIAVAPKAVRLEVFYYDSNMQCGRGNQRILFHIPEKMLGSCIFVYCTGACDNPASSSGHKNQPEDHGGRKLLYGT